MDESSKSQEKHNDTLCNKEVDETVIANYDSLEEMKYNVMQTVDLCDLTFSSFTDVLSGDCSYFEDVSISDANNDGINRLQTSKQSHKNCVTSVQSENNQDDDDLLLTKNDAFEQKINDLIKNDMCNFYHVFEVIDNPVREKDTQDQVSKVGSIKCKSHKNQRHKKKRKAVAGAIRKGQRYLPNFKRKVLDYASSHTFKETALHFNVNCNTITEWAREKKRLSPQQKSTTSMPDSVCQYKTEIDHTPATKTDIIILDDSITIETESNDNLIKKIEQDLPLGDMRSDKRFLEWVKIKRKEEKELSRDEVYQAAKHCMKKCMSNCEQPVWFILWLKRYEKTLKNSDKSDHETEKYIMYPNNFKLEVALYAKLFTKNSAARVFNVPRRRIFDWFNCSKCLNSSDNTSASAVGNDACGRKVKTRSNIYEELHEWYKKKYSEGFSPNSSEIKAKASELFKANGIVNIKFSEGWLQKFCKRLNIKLRHTRDDRLLLWILAQFDNNVTLSHQEITEKSSKLVGKRKEFKGSKGWTLRFLKRHSNFLQQVPTIDDKLPDIVQCEIDKFCSSFRFTLNSRNINSSSIGCMDEIPVSFNYPQDGKSTNLPLLRKTGFENCQAVVLLCMLADGRVLPPAVVLRGSGPRQVLSDGNSDILILYQEKGLVDDDIVQTWVEYMWLSFVSPPSILIADSFKPHCSPELKERLARNNSVLFIIPEGCSSQLQPLDIEITPKFKESIKNQWKELPSNEVEYVSKMSKKCRCPDQDTTLHWIRNAYRKIEENPYSIINSFKVIGLID